MFFAYLIEANKTKVCVICDRRSCSWCNGVKRYFITRRIYKMIQVHSFLAYSPFKCDSCTCYTVSTPNNIFKLLSVSVPALALLIISRFPQARHL
jgi:thioredoxin-related protein